MKIRSVLAIGLSTLFVVATGCGPGKEKMSSAAVGSTMPPQAFSSSVSDVISSSQNVSSGVASGSSASAAAG